MKNFLKIIGCFILISCNIQGSGTSIKGDFRPGFTPLDNTAQTTPTPSPTPTPTPASTIKIPVLQSVTSKNFPSTYVEQNVALSLDVTDTANTPESVNTFTCTFDKIPDGAVASGTSCAQLPGTVVTTNLASAGQITWTPNIRAYGAFEFKFQATNSAGTASVIFVVDVRSAFSQTDLVAYYDSQFADLTSPLLNTSTAKALWRNLTTAGSAPDGTLTSFDFTGSSGWGGNGEKTISSTSTGSYRLMFDGTDDVVNFGTTWASLTDISVEAWVRPAAAATAGAVIFSSSDNGTNTGITLRQSTGTAGTLQLLTGDGTLVCESTQVLENDIWYQVAATYDSGTATIILYINGTQECTQTAGGNLYTASPNDFRIGSDTAGANFWSGAVGEMRVYQSVLSATTIKNNFYYTMHRFPYVPTTIASTSLSLWLDASVGVTESSNSVSYWEDQSGNNNHATSVASKFPTYVSSGINSKPVIRFSSAGSVMKIADSSSLRPDGITILAVFIRQAASMNSAKIIARPYDTAESGGAPYFSWSFGPRFAGNDTFNFSIYTAIALSDAETTTTYTDGTPYMVQASYHSGTNTQSALVNGAASAFNAVGQAPTGIIDNSQTGQNIWIGDSPMSGGGVEQFDGDLAEILIYAGVPTANERLRIQSYLNAKYALYP